MTFSQHAHIYSFHTSNFNFGDFFQEFLSIQPLVARQDGDALPLLRSSDGNVSCWGTGLYHHAYWQMVEQHISTLHQKASGAVLPARRKTNAHIPVVLNNTGDCTTSSFDQGPPAAQPLQQCQDKTKYWRRHVLTGETAVFFLFQLID
jgi:hypothetical protein